MIRPDCPQCGEALKFWCSKMVGEELECAYYSCPYQNCKISTVTIRSVQA